MHFNDKHSYPIPLTYNNLEENELNYHYEET